MQSFFNKLHDSQRLKLARRVDRVFEAQKECKSIEAWISIQALQNLDWSFSQIDAFAPLTVDEGDFGEYN